MLNRRKRFERFWTKKLQTLLRKRKPILSPLYRSLYSPSQF